jgi:hypothetical protein
MKNFPHQFNDLTKLYNALGVIRSLINAGTPLTDENFGEQLTRQEIYTYRDKTLSIDQFLANKQTKPASNRGYLTVARDIRRFFELLGFITVLPDKIARLSPAANQLLLESSPEIRKGLWKNALLQLGLEGTDGEVSHPYRILLKLVNLFPGIETSKLMLALEAENDSDEEFERISSLAGQSIANIIAATGTSESMAANAVKILPGIAAQLGDIERTADSRAYLIGQVVITEDEITTEERESPTRTRPATPFRQTSAADIARDPNLNVVTSVSIDLTESIRIRQRRLAEHQEIVRLLAGINESHGFGLFEGKFDCLSSKNTNALLFEVKTLLQSVADEEKQTVKGVGQLKYYKFSIVDRQMGYTNTKEFLVFSIKPSVGIIEFCSAENINVMWRDGDTFKVFNRQTGVDDLYNPDNFTS